jgi:hypothetical protein
MTRGRTMNVCTRAQTPLMAGHYSLLTIRKEMLSTLIIVFLVL